MISLVNFFYKKYNNLVFEMNNKTLYLPFYYIAFMAIDSIAKIVKLQMLYLTGWQ